MSRGERLHGALSANMSDERSGGGGPDGGLSLRSTMRLFAADDVACDGVAGAEAAGEDV